MTLDPAILARILEEPDNDTHRLIAADWLDENGEGGMAEFVRVQMELAQHDKQYFQCDEEDCSLCEKADELRRREHLLLMHHFAYLKFGDLTLTSVDNPNPAGQPTMVYRRGFLHTIRCSAAEWQRGQYIKELRTIISIGQQILRHHPVERVEFSDCGVTIQIDHLPETFGYKLPWQLLLVGTASRCQIYKTRDELIDAMPQQLRAWGVGESVWSQIHSRPYRYEEVTTNV